MGRSLQIFGVAAAVSGMAFIEQAVAAEGVSGSDPLPQVIVTAQKRVQNQIAVPIALSAFQAADLERLHVRDLNDLAIYVPGLIVEEESARNPVLIIRGISTADAEVTTEPRVSVFQDGVSASRLQGSMFTLFDEERVEVARGPQSTLFGRSALIGAVSVIENKASTTSFQGDLRAEFGNYNEQRYDGMVNIPVSDTLALRFAGQHYSRDGYVKNALGGPALDNADTDAYRASLVFKPTSRIRADIIFNYQKDQSDGVSYKSGTFYPSNLTTGATLGTLSPYGTAALAAGSGFAGGQNLGGKRELWSGTGILEADLSHDLKLTSTTGYRHFQTSDVEDYDGTALPIITSGDDTRGDQYSEDLRVNFEPKSWFSAFFGTGVFQEKDNRFVPVETDDRDVLALLTGVINRSNPVLAPQSTYTNVALLSNLIRAITGFYGAPVSATEATGIASNLQGDHQESYTRTNDDFSWDLYGDATIRPISNVELEAGLRYTDSRKTSSFGSTVQDRSILAGLLGALTQTGAARSGLLQALSVPGAAFIPQSAAYPVPMFALTAQPTANGQTDSQSLTDGGLSWRMTGRYIVSPTTNLYASYARGRRPEVLEVEAPASPGGLAQFTHVAAETVDSFEIGSKSRAFGGRLEYELAVYDYSYNHFATVVQNGTQFLTTDAGNANAYGLEAQVRASVTSWSELFGSYSYNHGRFSSGLYDGNHFRLTPDNVVTVGADLHHSLMAGVIDLVPTYSWRSSAFYDDTNGKFDLLTGALLAPLTYQASQPAYGLLNVRMAFTPNRSNWKAEAFINNALNQKYIRDTGAGDLDFGLPTYIAGPPIMGGVALSYHY